MVPQASRRSRHYSITRLRKKGEKKKKNQSQKMQQPSHTCFSLSLLGLFPRKGGATQNVTQQVFLAGKIPLSLTPSSANR